MQLESAVLQSIYDKEYGESLPSKKTLINARRRQRMDSFTTFYEKHIPWISKLRATNNRGDVVDVSSLQLDLPSLRRIARRLDIDWLRFFEHNFREYAQII